MTPDSDSPLDAFIDALPKGEHHLHLEGSTPWHLMQASDPARYTAPPASWAHDFRFKDFAEFEALVLEYVVPWLDSPQRYAQTAADILGLRAAENVRYAEVSIAGIALELSGMSFSEVAGAVKSAVPAGMEVRLFVGLHHAGFGSYHDQHLGTILDCPEIDGLDLHGPEAFPLAPWIVDYWHAARAQGMLTKAHAGEFTGAAPVREVIETLGVTKVQHGVHAWHDPAVVRLAAEREVSLDVCPLSNVKLGAVPDLASHPVLALQRAGVRCTLNTDDPFVFGNRLRDDYRVVADVLGATPAELAQFARDSIITADLDSVTRARLCAEIDAVCAAADLPEAV